MYELGKTIGAMLRYINEIGTSQSLFTSSNNVADGLAESFRSNPAVTHRIIRIEKDGDARQPRLGLPEPTKVEDKNTALMLPEVVVKVSVVSDLRTREDRRRSATARLVTSSSFPRRSHQTGEGICGPHGPNVCFSRAFRLFHSLLDKGVHW